MNTGFIAGTQRVRDFRQPEDKSPSCAALVHEAGDVRNEDVADPVLKEPADAGADGRDYGASEKGSKWQTANSQRTQNFSI
jgi:hypothetical protein